MFSGSGFHVPKENDENVGSEVREALENLSGKEVGRCINLRLVPLKKMTVRIATLKKSRHASRHPLLTKDNKKGNQT